MEGKPVHKGGGAKGGQRGPHKRPGGQDKTVPGGEKNGAKSILGSNPFRKVPGVFFLFSACTLIFTLLHTIVVGSRACVQFSL